MKVDLTLNKREINLIISLLRSNLTVKEYALDSCKISFENGSVRNEHKDDFKKRMLDLESKIEESNNLIEKITGFTK